MPSVWTREHFNKRCIYIYVPLEVVYITCISVTHEILPVLLLVKGIKRSVSRNELKKVSRVEHRKVARVERRKMSRVELRQVSRVKPTSRGRSHVEV